MTIKLKPSYIKWTPNELADVLRNWIGNREQLLAAANILQDQAKEIEHLKKIVEDAIKQAFYEDDYYKLKEKFDAQTQEIEQLKEVLEKIIVISDRKHDAWDQAKDLLKKDMK